MTGPESSEVRPPPAPSTEVVGRDAELRAVEDVLRTSAPGAVAIVLDGEAGIGKTTVWRAGLEAARSDGLPVLSASPGEAETGLAFAGVADLLDPVLADLLPRLPQPQRRALEIAVLMRDPADSTPDPRAIGSAFLGLARLLAARGPVVVAIDDLQWLDPPSAGVLRFVLRRLDTEPVRLLLARRSAPSDPPPFELDRSRFADRVSWLRLGPISLGALHRVLRERFGVALARPLLIRVHEAAEGNTFFALEMARELRRTGAAPGPGEPLPVPPTSRALVAERISRLPSDVREVLLVVAALPSPSPALVEAALGSEAVEALHAASDRELLDVRGDRIRFAHPLIRSGVYERAAPGERRHAHRLLADQVGTAEERARQLALGTDPPDERVATVLDEAAERSAGRGAPETAAELSEWALRLTPPEDQDALVRRSTAAGRHHLVAGDTGRARAGFERALGATVDPALRARARHGLAWAALRDTGWLEFTRLLTEALDDAAEPAFRCQIELDLAGGLMQSDELRHATPHAERATGLARGLARPDLLAESLSYQAMAQTLTGEGARMEVVREGLAAAGDAERLGDRGDAGDLPPELGFGAVLKWADDFSGARRVLDRLLLGFERTHAYAKLPPALFQLAELEIWAGNWARASDLSSRCRELAEQTGNTTFEPVALHPQARLHALRGETDAARQAGRAGLELCRQIANLRHEIRFHAVLGFTELSAGEAAAAREHLDRAAELASTAGYGEPAVFRFEQDRVESLLALGDLAAAHTLIERLEEHARLRGGPWCGVMAERGRGLLSAAQGDLGAATANLERALTAHERLDQPFERGRTLLALGAVSRRARQRGVARETLAQAAATFEELGAPLWAARAREDMQRLGGRRRAGAELTPAEERIAGLVARGHSNKEVAAELFLATKTVETQLSRIYSKLGVRSRTELAHRFASRSEAGEL